MRKILIAGASGFIGKALIESLLDDPNVEIIALSRRCKISQHPRLEWRKCDLFSLKDIAEVMVGCETVYYLVHSMLPSATLSQGTFYDFDLIMADNFVRASIKHSVQHIIYLGGMIPISQDLSWHLKSRFEVEETFRSSGIKTTVLRAGLIIGPQGSSFTILERLVKRLPIMICPAWTKTLSRPVALRDVIRILRKVLYLSQPKGGIYDLVGPEIVTYQSLIEKVGLIIKKKSKLLTWNIIPLSLSRLWVRLVTGIPKNLVYPLVLSLRYQMLPTGHHDWPYSEDLNTGLDEALKLSLNEVESTQFVGHLPKENDVRSIQRMPLPSGKNAQWVAEEYFRWLPQFFSTLIKVDLSGERCAFYLIDPSIKLLVLERSLIRSSPDRQLLYIVGGLLAGEQERGRLEFRDVLNKKYVMAAIHEFRPALPWFIYRWTQALVHLIVMKAFGEHLKWIIISKKR